jgi:hypothetical protein
VPGGEVSLKEMKNSASYLLEVKFLDNVIVLCLYFEARNAKYIRKESPSIQVYHKSHLLKAPNFLADLVYLMPIYFLKSSVADEI